MTMKTWRMGLLALLLGWALSSLAQQDAAVPDQPAANDAGAEPVPEQQPAVSDPDAEPVAENEQEPQGRFIPTEQISQDLGVSFPVDI
jgi:hypothetical protein